MLYIIRHWKVLLMGLYDDFQWMLQYTKMLDPINAKILEGLGTCGPRNIRFLAKSNYLPPTTVGFRIKKLIKEGYLSINANLDHSKLGLMKAVLLTDPLPGIEERFYESIDSFGFWTYMTKCYGKFDGIYAIFAFPAEHKKELKDYLEKAVKLGVLNHYLLFWITNPCEVPPNFLWFDFEERRWDFQWQRWIEEILSGSNKLPENLRDPEMYPVTVDKTDLLILKELEKNAMVEFTKLGDITNLTPEGARYRYHKHILKQDLISDYSIAIFPYPPQISDMHIFMIEFRDGRALAKFANSLWDKPFIISYAKVIGENSMIAHTYTPKTEFPNLMESLNQLAVHKLVKSFFHVTLNFTSFKHETVSYKHFKDGTWIYDHERNLQRLREIIEHES